MASLPFPDGDDTCVQWAQKNPKKLGSLSFERYERYKGSRTVREAKARGAIRADFENDHKKGFMKIVKRSGAMSAAEAEGTKTSTQVFSSLFGRQPGTACQAPVVPSKSAEPPASSPLSVEPAAASGAGFAPVSPSKNSAQAPIQPPAPSPASVELAAPSGAGPAPVAPSESAGLAPVQPLAAAPPSVESAAPSGAGPAAAAAGVAAVAAASGVMARAASTGGSQLTEEQKARISENRRKAEERRAAKKRALECLTAEQTAPATPPQQQPSLPQAPAVEGKAATVAQREAVRLLTAMSQAKNKQAAAQQEDARAARSPQKSEAPSTLAVETPEKRTPPSGRSVAQAAQVPQWQAQAVKPVAQAPLRPATGTGGGGKFASVGGAWDQFNGVYCWRLQQLRGPVLQEARKLWGGMLPPQSFVPDVGCYKRGVEGSEVVIVGVAFKSLQGRTDVIKMYRDAVGFGHISEERTRCLGRSICSDGDSVWLEDQVMRLRLALPPEHASRIATGVVLAARGVATTEDGFRPSAICYAAGPAPPPLPPPPAGRAPGPFLALVSGLGFGARGAEGSGLSAARERLWAWLAAEGSRAAPGAVQKLLVCGGLVSGESQDKGSVVAAMADADAALAKIAAVVPTEVMPGLGDPSSLSLPQMPLHPYLFRQSRQLGAMAFKSVSNPFSCELDGVHILGHSGQPVMDLLRGTRLEAPMGALQLSLEVLHLAPTAPDSLPSQPFVDRDPFVIDRVPHVLFSGGHSKAEHCFRRHPGGDSGTMCICVPAFHLQPAVVLVNLRDPRDVRIHELGDTTMQDAC